jgi:hypothetical protein
MSQDRGVRRINGPALVTVTLGIAMKAQASFRTPVKASPSEGSSTQAIYRALLVRGLRPGEAANLTAFMCEIPVGRQPWKIDEVNRLLFLRQLHEAGRFRPTTGE